MNPEHLQVVEDLKAATLVLLHRLEGWRGEHLGPHLHKFQQRVEAIRRNAGARTLGMEYDSLLTLLERAFVLRINWMNQSALHEQMDELEDLVKKIRKLRGEHKHVQEESGGQWGSK